MTSRISNGFFSLGEYIYRIEVSLLSALLVGTIAWAAEPAKLSGIVFTVGHDRIRMVWPNARVTLKNLDTGKEITTTSNSLE